MHRIPVTLADLQGTRYKSSLSKFKKHSLSVMAVPKLCALREAFAKALGYGTEAELRFYAKKLGDSYTGVALPVTDVIESVSKRIARQWDVRAEHADKIAYSLGLQHFDACRTTPRVNLRNIDGDETSRSATQVLRVEPLEAQSFEEDRAAIHAVPQSLTSNTLQADLDGLQFERDRFKAERDRLAKANPALTAMDRAMKANSALMAMDRAMKANSALTAMDRAMKANSALTAMDRAMKANPALMAIDRVMKANSALTAIDRMMNANPALTAIDRIMNANLRVAERWSLEDGDAENEH